MLDETINVYLQTIFVTPRSMFPSPPTVGLQEAVKMVVLMRHMIPYGPANSNTNGVLMQHMILYGFASRLLMRRMTIGPANSSLN